MKLKTYTINDQGEVCEVLAFSRGLSMPEVQAKTKSEASAKLLLQAKAALSEYPEVHIKDGAWALLMPVENGWVGSAGPIKERGEYPQQTSCGGAAKKTKKEALESCSFFYYASTEYREACAPV
jgi:hypothetical protein